MNNYICSNCNKLLFRGKVKDDVIEIKCSKCGCLNSTSKEITKTDIRISFKIKN